MPVRCGIWKYFFANSVSSAKPVPGSSSSENLEVWTVSIFEAQRDSDFESSEKRVTPLPVRNVEQEVTLEIIRKFFLGTQVRAKGGDIMIYSASKETMDSLNDLKKGE